MGHHTGNHQPRRVMPTALLFAVSGSVPLPDHHPLLRSKRVTHARMRSPGSDSAREEPGRGRSFFCPPTSGKAKPLGAKHLREHNVRTYSKLLSPR